MRLAKLVWLVRLVRRVRVRKRIGVIVLATKRQQQRHKSTMRSRTKWRKRHMTTIGIVEIRIVVISGDDEATAVAPTATEPSGRRPARRGSDAGRAPRCGAGERPCDGDGVSRGALARGAVLRLRSREPTAFDSPPPRFLRFPSRALSPHHRILSHLKYRIARSGTNLLPRQVHLRRRRHRRRLRTRGGARPPSRPRRPPSRCRRPPCAPRRRLAPKASQAAARRLAAARARPGRGFLLPPPALPSAVACRCHRKPDAVARRSAAARACPSRGQSGPGPTSRPAAARFLRCGDWNRVGGAGPGLFHPGPARFTRARETAPRRRDCSQ